VIAMIEESVSTCEESDSSDDAKDELLLE